MASCTVLKSPLPSCATDSTTVPISTATGVIALTLTLSLSLLSLWARVSSSTLEFITENPLEEGQWNQLKWKLSRQKRKGRINYKSMARVKDCAGILISLLSM